MAERETIKIAFVGTSCIGKTTLVEAYRKRFADSFEGIVVDEAARDFFSRNPHVQDRFSTDIQRQIQTLALSNEKAAHAKGTPIIVCDRSVIDAVAYTRAYGDIEGARVLLAGVEHWLPTYNRIFLLNPADVPYQQDAIRQESEEVRQRFHAAFLELFMEAETPYELLSGTVDERIARVDAVINGK